MQTLGDGETPCINNFLQNLIYCIGVLAVSNKFVSHFV